MPNISADQKKTAPTMNQSIEEDEMLFHPQEPSILPPGFTKQHTGYNTYQDQYGARSAVNTPYAENFQYQDSLNPSNSGYQQDCQAGSSYLGSLNHRFFPESPSHQQVSFNLPREHVDKNSNIWRRSVRKYQRAEYTSLSDQDHYSKN